MEVGLVVLGMLIGWFSALGFDTFFYRESKTFTKTLDDAQNRIDGLQNEVATLRRENAELAAQADQAPGGPNPLSLAPVNADHDRISELEARLERLHHESTESERRARLFEARLTDVTSELASLQYGLPTLDRKAEDELESPIS